MRGVACVGSEEFWVFEVCMGVMGEASTCVRVVLLLAVPALMTMPRRLMPVMPRKVLAPVSRGVMTRRL
ncbi:hypothetical protein PLEOSDRAFT_1089287 [Pleurotus ostreatus PC15]|uniref:Uncharacterized protein n=1 Tax=Pleurotus ostreatus (strain PC15) TaxID=1137138 RepID=A0A067NT78_PLEO1|nr:hypothetical protein PLEOSDRAFT_1089287 [Pleurotus ostreatus PC15]